jgi:hypothetical protein
MTSQAGEEDFHARAGLTNADALTLSAKGVGSCHHISLVAPHFNLHVSDPSAAASWTERWLIGRAKRLVAAAGVAGCSHVGDMTEGKPKALRQELTRWIPLVQTAGHGAASTATKVPKETPGTAGVSVYIELLQHVAPHDPGDVM